MATQVETQHPEPQGSTELPTQGSIGASLVKDELFLKGDDSPLSSVPSEPSQLIGELMDQQTTPTSPKEVSSKANANDRDELVSHIPSFSSSSSGDSPDNLSDICRDKDPFTDAHNTPNGSVTSNSLVSPLSQVKSASPSAQLTSSLYIATASHRARRKDVSPIRTVRPRSSIPSRLPSHIYAQQCVAAAYASRLNPYALHKGEQALLENHLCHLHVTTYLNIRNGILRLWTRNPMVSVTEEEALGCAKDFRWMGLASVAYNWLVRNGYINFGCIDIPKPPNPPKRSRKTNGPTIIVIGAGMAGLGCARQLHGLFQHYDSSQGTPKVIVLEGRKRIGGRIYSHPLQCLKSDTLPPGVRSTAEMGAQIIVGFDRGNPLDPIVRAQLALRYHLLKDISTIYDTDGSPVNQVQDSMAEMLYNDILDRSGAYRHSTVVTPTAEGDRESINLGRDSKVDDGITIKQYEDAAASGNIGLLLPAKRVRRGVSHKTTDVKPPAGAPVSNPREAKEHPAALACQAMGWKWRPGVTRSDTLELDEAAKTKSLGAVMDEGVRQYQKILPLTPKDMRLINWHFANLEYANASPAGRLSLSGWDQDMGNEFDGEHSQVIGGYQQVPRGLWSFPEKLDVRTGKIVTKIVYDPHGTSNHKARVHCEDGQVIQADKVVLTCPLGVLKKRAVEFVPPLPDWKTGAIDRLGFGIMNKVILVFEKPFWDTTRDMFGLLREPRVPNSMSQADYVAGRGKSYLFWNCMKTSGLPTLVALMAGEAAYEAERLTDAEILGDVTSQLRNIFKDVAVPDPLETIITRWGQDRFTYGSYSSVAAEAKPDDYDLMAQSIGNLHFAGEATCGTHPATVHGAYLSGLRAASEILESIIGPIEIPSPLVRPKTTNGAAPVTATPPTPPTVSAVAGQKRKAPDSDPLPVSSSQQPAQAADAPKTQEATGDSVLRDIYNQELWAAIIAELGPAEPAPRKLALNPFLYYQKDYWQVCKTRCDEARRAAAGNDSVKAGRDEVRQALGQMWRDATDEIKKPYLDTVAANREQNEREHAEWKARHAEWERRTYEVKDRWCKENPFETWKEAKLKEQKN
ncbi:hypothetical protein VTO42DRAFT_446 [Malbranchea cinnamomea]